MSDPSRTQGYRCERCGNKTRFDIFETVRRRRFAHFTLGGAESTEEEEILSRQVDDVICRWCGTGEEVAPVDR